MTRSEKSSLWVLIAMQHYGTSESRSVRKLSRGVRMEERPGILLRYQIVQKELKIRSQFIQPPSESFSVEILEIFQIEAMGVP